MTDQAMLETMAKLLAPIQETLQTMSARFDGVDERLDGIDKRLDGIGKRLDSVDKRLDGVDERLDGVEKRLDGVEKRLDSVEERLDAVEQEARKANVVLETEIRRDINLLFEGHQLILERLTPREAQEALEERVSTLEAVSRLHGEQLRELKRA